MGQGWDLIGNSTDAPLDVANSFGDSSKVTTVWKWMPTKGKWAFFTPSLLGQSLTDYAASKGYDVLVTVNAGEGIWVNAIQPFSIYVPAGNAIPDTVLRSTLSQGWNLSSVGRSQTPSQFTTAVGSNITSLWVWDNALMKWYFYSPSLEASGTLSAYVASKGYLDFATNNKLLQPGAGFWVNAP